MTTGGKRLTAAGAAMLACILLVTTSSKAQERKVPADKDSTEIMYHLVHPLHKIDAESKDVECAAEIDPSARSIKSVSVDVDVTTFDSGNSNRDSHAMEVIDAIDYPEASFVSTHIQERGDSLFVTGKLTFHGVTHDVTISASPKWLPSEVIVNGGFDILLSDYKIERPSLLMIPVDNTLWFTLSAVFRL